MRFVLFVEGDTEQRVLPAFLKRWLDPRLSQKVGVQPVKFTGWSELVKNLVNRAHAYLRSPGSSEIIAVVSLLDLYGPNFYPANVTTANQRYAWAKADLEGKVGHPKFRQHFAVHECEAWLLSDLSLFPREVSTGLPGKCNQPEEVNFDEPPKKLLQKCYRERLRETYKEVIHGLELFAELDPCVVRGKCPRFRELLEDMITLAEKAGLKRVTTT
jgi:Domain of unknown function (DUF4276)